MSRTDSEPTDMAALRRAWTLADEGDADGGRARSEVEAERVWRAVAGELSPGEIRALATEAATDPDLARSWRLARELHEAAVAAGGSTLHAPRRFPAARWAAAAIVVLGVGLGLAFRSGLFHEADASAVRGGPSSSRIAAITPDGAALPREGFVLRWAPLEEARTRYAVRVTTADLLLVAEVEGLEVAEYRLAAPAFAEVRAGTRLFWQVEARLPDGRIETSAAFAVVLRD